MRVFELQTSSSTLSLCNDSISAFAYAVRRMDGKVGLQESKAKQKSGSKQSYNSPWALEPGVDKISQPCFGLAATMLSDSIPDAIEATKIHIPKCVDFFKQFDQFAVTRQHVGHYLIFLQHFHILRGCNE